MELISHPCTHYECDHAAHHGAHPCVHCLCAFSERTYIPSSETITNIIYGIKGHRRKIFGILPKIRAGETKQRSIYSALAMRNQSAALLSRGIADPIIINLLSRQDLMHIAASYCNPAEMADADIKLAILKGQREMCEMCLYEIKTFPENINILHAWSILASQFEIRAGELLTRIIGEHNDHIKIITSI